MTNSLTRRLEELEQRTGKGKDIINFWSRPQVDDSVKAAELEADRTGRPLLLFRWKTLAGSDEQG